MSINNIKTREALKFSLGEILCYILFLASPILALFLALKNITKSWSKNILWVFSGFMGFCFVIDENSTGDAFVYRERFYEYIQTDYNYSQLFENLFRYGSEIEIVERLISVTIGKFTDNYHFLFLGYGLFFGFFFSRNIWYAVQHYRNVNSKGSLIAILGLFFSIPIWNINGFDFWASSQVFLYGALPLLIEKKYSRVVFILICPLIHFSFYLLILLLVIYRIVKAQPNTLFIFYVLSFFMFWLDKSLFASLAERILPELIFSRANVYLLTEQNERNGGTIMFVINVIYSFYLNIVFIFLYFKRKNFIFSNPLLSNLFIAIFYFTACFNFLDIIPSMDRFLFISKSLMWVFLILLLGSNDFISIGWIRKYLNYGLVILVFYWLSIITRFLFPLLGIKSFLGGPILATILIEDDFVIGTILEYLGII